MMKGLGRLARFLVRSAREVEVSRLHVVLFIAGGVFSGVGSVILLALINRGLHAPGAPGREVWLFAFLCLAIPAARVGSQYALSRVTQESLFGLREFLSRQVLAAPTRELEKLGSHRLLATLTDDVMNISGGIATVPLLSMHVTVLTACIIYLGVLSPPLLFLVLLFVAVGIFIYQYPVRLARRQFLKVREAWDDMFKQIRTLVDGNKELKLHGHRRESFFRELFVPTAEQMRRYTIRGNVINSVGLSLGQILFFVLVALLIYVIPVPAGPRAEVLTGYTLVCLYMLTPLEVIMNLAPALTRASVALDKVNELGLFLERQESDLQDDDPPKPREEWGSLELVDVTHRYYRESEDDSFTLGPIDLRIDPGELVFVVGGNGSGKTTLAKLLLGLYKPETGEIRFDGVPLDERNRDAYRQHFAAVFTDFFLFETFLGLDRDGLDEEATEYLKRLHLDRKVQVQDGRLSTLTLSQGQRKRLALLTAWLEDRPIYLFDEWAADQDPQFKEVFYHNLLPSLRGRGRTVIVISHDERYYGVADRILRLEEGQLVADDWQTPRPERLEDCSEPRHLHGSSDPAGV
jgi:putative ATP-binding cassette transporter